MNNIQSHVGVSWGWINQMKEWDWNRMKSEREKKKAL